jgi:3-phosphoshikimate 1-carboxyvinyltransferase
MDLRVRGPTRSLTGDARVPGDKSIGHRAVMLGSIAHGLTRVIGLSGGEDNKRTIAVMRALGVRMRELGPATLEPATLEIEGRGVESLTAPAGSLDCGNSGTSLRLFLGLLSGQPFVSRLTGDQYLRARPMRRVVDPLRAMGGELDGRPGKKADEIYPPIEVRGVGAGRLRGLRHVSQVPSAQVKSALLLAGLTAEGPTTVVEPARSRDHSERMLSAMGAPLTVSGLEVTLDPRGWDRRLAARTIEVAGDLSSAAFLLAAAVLVPGSRVVVRGVGCNPTRTGVLDALVAMGGNLARQEEREVAGEPICDLVGMGSPLRAIEISGELALRAIDELPLLAALAAHAEGTTVIRDAAELRVKESDRVATTAKMLRAFGVEVEERPDGLVIDGRGPKALRAGEVDSHGDHRIAMAGAVCALGVRGHSLIRDADNIATSFPGFAPLLTALGAEIA